MEIINFETTTINAKNNQEYIKILLITLDDSSTTSVYTSFMKLENSIKTMLMTPDFSSSLRLIDLIFVGKFGYDSRYAATLGFDNVDGLPEICNIILTKNY